MEEEIEQEIERITAIYNMVTEFLVAYSFQLIGAAIILLLGILFAKKISGFIFNLLSRKDIDITLSRFAAGSIKIIIIVMVVIMALGKIGISITPFIAAVGALSLGAGLALQGLLSNYGAGVSIIVARPFVVGDTITVQGVTGLVEEVNLGYTILSNEDEVRITIPNKHIIGEILHNSHADSIVEMTVGIAYHCDPIKAVEVITTSLKDLEGVSDEREPQVGIDNFGDSSIDIGVRFWAKTSKLFDTKYRANMAIYKTLADNNIEIPFPQRDVRIVQGSA